MSQYDTGSEVHEDVDGSAVQRKVFRLTARNCDDCFSPLTMVPFSA